MEAIHCQAEGMSATLTTHGRALDHCLHLREWNLHYLVPAACCLYIEGRRLSREPGDAWALG